MNEDFRKMCRSLEIEHHVVGIEDHRSNGRVDRVIRTIRDGVVKLGGDMSLKRKIEVITEKYNRMYHVGIKCFPLEAIKESRWEAVVNNTSEGSFSKRFNSSLNNENHVKGDGVMVCKRDNVKNKDEKGRFLE